MEAKIPTRKLSDTAVGKAESSERRQSRIEYCDRWQPPRGLDIDPAAGLRLDNVTLRRLVDGAGPETAAGIARCIGCRGISLSNCEIP